MQHPLLQEFAQLINDIPFNRILGLHLELLEKEKVTLRFDMKKELIGNFFYGILHGGVISSVLDMAGGVVAMLSTLQKHPDKTPEELKEILTKSSTVDLHVSYVHPGKGEHFIATAKVMHSGKRLCFTHIELHNNESKLIATGTGTYLIG